jgi:hypothetical protein
MTTERRGKWQPSKEQISLAIDCATARMPIERAAALLNIGPRTLRIFSKRAGSPVFEAWRAVSRSSGAARMAKAPRPPAACPVPRLPVAVGHLRDFRTRA